MRYGRMLFCLGVLLLLGGNMQAGDAWRYVVPPPDDPFANPPPRALALSDQKPSDLAEEVRYRGGRRRYSQLTYGGGRTARVAVVADEVRAGEIDLYVDADRDRKITAKDRVAGGPTWRVPLAAAVPQGEAVRELPRTLFLRYGRASRTLSVATCGYLEGRAVLDGKAVAVRRVDGDANGLVADPQDRVWVDLDGDGTWDAASEEFLFTPILPLGGQRFAVRADAAGERLALARLEGTGTLRLALPAALRPEQVDEIQVTVQSRDGVVAALRGLKAEAAVPTGEYRVSSLLLTLKAPAGGTAWGYVFGDNGGKDARWHRLGKDQALALDPVGALDFTATAGGDKGECRAGEALSVRPALYTGDGLLIERAYRGEFETNAYGSGCAGRIALVGSDGRALDSATSGFA